MPTFAEIAGLLGQYFRDAAPGGELNREVQPQVVGDVARGGLLGLTADTLGTPVDLAAMAMRPLGYSHPKPVGGSDWLAERMTTPTGSGAETAARTVTGLLTPSPADVAHLVPGLLGATVWHGSPHKFDKFDISKIGTGEGAQAYGHGLYVADSKTTAQSYQHGLSDWYPNGEKPTPGSMADRAAAYVAEAIDSQSAHPLPTAIQKIKRLESDEKAKDAMLKEIGKWSESGAKWKRGELYKVDLPDEHIAKMLDWDKPLSQQPESVRGAFEKLGFDVSSTKYKTDKDWHSAAYKYLSSKEATKLVNTDLNAADDIFAARKAWNKGPDDFMEYLNSAPWLRGVLTKGKGGDKNGSAAYGLLSDNMGGFGSYVGQGGGQVKASEKLRELGIPGIKYLDGGSRTAGEGTRNYVVFDDSLLKILERQ